MTKWSNFAWCIWILTGIITFFNGLTNRNTSDMTLGAFMVVVSLNNLK